MVMLQDGPHLRAGSVQDHPLIGLANCQNAADLFGTPLLNVTQDDDLALAGGQGLDGELCVTTGFLRKKLVFGRRPPAPGWEGPVAGHIGDDPGLGTVPSPVQVSTVQHPGPKESRTESSAFPAPPASWLGSPEYERATFLARNSPRSAQFPVGLPPRYPARPPQPPLHILHG